MPSPLTKEEVQELNSLLADKSINIPDFRREIHITGNNVDWLRKRIHLRNPNLNPRITALLNRQA